MWFSTYFDAISHVEYCNNIPLKFYWNIYYYHRQLFYCCISCWIGSCFHNIDFNESLLYLSVGSKTADLPFLTTSFVMACSDSLTLSDAGWLYTLYRSEVLRHVVFRRRWSLDHLHRRKMRNADELIWSTLLPRYTTACIDVDIAYSVVWVTVNSH